MKIKILIVLLSIFSIASLNANPVKKGVQIVVTEKATPEQRERAKELQARLDKIQAMDYNSLSKEEKDAVKKEVKEIKKEVKQMREGVYLYLGGGVLLIILIVILIIML
jgi:Skp family chaperone for outer membrane proteins